jgi:hypothetical protein
MQHLGVDLPANERLKLAIWHTLIEAYIESRGFNGWTHLHATFYMEVQHYPAQLKNKGDRTGTSSSIHSALSAFVLFFCVPLSIFSLHLSIESHLLWRGSHNSESKYRRPLQGGGKGQIPLSLH